MQNKLPIIDGKYEILTKLGEGGMSRVYLARDKRLNKQWAVKELKTTGNPDQDAAIVQSFIREANMMKRLDHPFLPRIVDIVEEQDSVFVVMDYIEGQSLSKILKEHGAQPQESVIEWGLDLCETLDYLHTRTPPIIFRDMKPSNVMLRPDGTVRIVDFGIAREYKEADSGIHVEDTTILGTKGYAAPEQFGGIGQTDQRTDVYCLGATLYHLLTGISPADPPYEMYPIRQVDPSLSPGLEKIITRCVQPNPAARYQSCAELYYALENYEKVDDDYNRRQRNKLRAFIVSAGLTVVLALGGIIGLVGNNIVLSNSYESLLDRAVKVPEEMRAQYFQDAIALKPGDTRGYLELMDFYKIDGMLDTAESDRLILLLETNLDKLKSSKGYAFLALEVGKLYWYYYEGKDLNDSQLTRAARARNWFQDATESSDEGLRRVAQVHYRITSFVTDLHRYAAEGEEEGVYREYYKDLLDLTKLLSTEHNQVVKLRACTTVLIALEMYADRFKGDGITQKELEKIYKKSVNILEKIQFNDLIYKDLYDQKLEIENRKEDVLRAIVDTYWTASEG
jgi:serine/threonine-protein kinase